MGAVIRTILAAVLALTSEALPAAADSRLDAETVIARSEAAIGNQVGNHLLTDSRGQPLPLASFRGKPLVISLVYTSCASVCPPTTQHVRESVARARRVLGEDAFAVLTLGFDARNDTPDRLAIFARVQGIETDGWQLASADAATIDAILSELGFSYAAATGGFEHITQTTILDAQGRVYRHVYGENFPEQVFLEPLKELVLGTTTRTLTLEGLVDRIRFICTVYNPASGAYEFDYAIAFGIVIGGFSLIVMGVVVFRLWRNNRRVLAARKAAQHG
jgi:protein SCO1/2